MTTMNTIIKFTVISAFIFGIHTAAAQSGYRIGLQISPNISYIPLEGEFKSGLNPNIGFGLMVNRYFDERYSFSSGLEFPTLSGKIRNEANDTSMSYRAGYIQVPLTIKMKTINFGYWTVFARVGGSVGVKYRENVEFSDPSLTKVDTDDSQVDGFLMTVTGSLGVEYDLGIESSLIISLDFHRSLLNQFNPRNHDFLSREQPRFSWFALNVGIIF
jgi:hypothetical protein